MNSVVLPTLPSFSLKSKRAVVTGAGRGLGLAVATGLAQAGAHVVLVARSVSEIEQAADSIRAAGGQAQASALDVTDTAAVADFFGSQEAFDILVNNAGTNRPKAMTEVSLEDFEAVMTLNLKSAYFVAQFCVKQMIKASKQGTLIHVSSQMGHVGGVNRSLYCASKWAMEGMNKAFALDLAKYGIRSNTVAPTFIETPLTTPFFEDTDFLKSVLSNIKLGRLGQVEDLMGAVVFLASDAAKLITGTSLVVDGGWTAE